MQYKGVNLCDFCFAPVEPGSVCKKCGCTHETYRLEAGLLPPGSNLMGKYIIGRVLGRGGFGATYLAYSSDLDKVVAIKEYLPVSIAYRDKDVENVTIVSDEKKAVFDKGAERFFDEAKTISKFNRNENIVSVHEFFYANGTVYYSMEYLDGVDLRKFVSLKGGRLDEATAVEIMKRLCNALMIVHSTQTLHRDISPDNIFVCSNGQVKLIDFGAAKQVVSDENQNYSVVVKQGFAPLEQYTRKGNQGVWTDIYAAGATMYYMLSGKVPPGAIDRSENASLELEKYTNISNEMTAILEHCMEVRYADRYQSVVEVLGDLQRLPLMPVDLRLEPEQEDSDSSAADFAAVADKDKKHKKFEDKGNKTEEKKELKAGVLSDIQDKNKASTGGAFKKKSVLYSVIGSLAACIILVVCLIAIPGNSKGDLSVLKEEQLEVYVDGEKVGTVDAFIEGDRYYLSKDLLCAVVDTRFDTARYTSMTLNDKEVFSEEVFGNALVLDTANRTVNFLSDVDTSEQSVEAGKTEENTTAETGKKDTSATQNETKKNDKKNTNNEQKPAEKKPAEQKPAEQKPVQKPATGNTSGSQSSVAKAPSSSSSGSTTKPAQKPAEQKPAQKPAEQKPVQKPAEQKPAEQKPAEQKPAQKPAEQKPAQKPAEQKPVQKPAEQKPADSSSGSSKRCSICGSRDHSEHPE